VVPDLRGRLADDAVVRAGEGHRAAEAFDAGVVDDRLGDGQSTGRNAGGLALLGTDEGEAVVAADNEASPPATVWGSRGARGSPMPAVSCQCDPDWPIVRWSMSMMTSLTAKAVMATPGCPAWSCSSPAPAPEAVAGVVDVCRLNEVVPVPPTAAGS
jgi:hypothetical protein